jgi:hypothetical protein
MHEMFVGHDEESSVVPGRGQFFPTGQALFPPATLAAQTEGLHPVPRLREIGGFHRAGTARRMTRQRLVLKSTDKLPMDIPPRSVFFGLHAVHSFPSYLA